jgi:hypothetical protein
MSRERLPSTLCRYGNNAYEIPHLPDLIIVRQHNFAANRHQLSYACQLSLGAHGYGACCRNCLALFQVGPTL